MGMPTLQHCKIHPMFLKFINQDVLPHTTVDKSVFWQEFEQLLIQLVPQNQALLEKRKGFQQQLEQWHKDNSGTNDSQQYHDFLQQIGYIEPEVPDFQVVTENVDAEITHIAGPQLVVPVSNARFALNAANARWGSLYDALYGTNAISTEGHLAPGNTYNTERGQAVINYAKDMLDNIFPLSQGSHKDVTTYLVYYNHLLAVFSDGSQSGLKTPNQCVALSGHKESPSSILLKNNHLHVELRFDANGAIGKHDPANINDIVMESAITTIMDFEDSVAAVDTDDKLVVYRNWLGLMSADLTASFKKDGKKAVRALAPSKVFTAPSGEDYPVSSRALLLARNVGHLMTTDLITDINGNQMPEGIIDAVVTALIGSIDLARSGSDKNSKARSIYIVKPKMHGSEEVDFCCYTFTRIEAMLGLAPNTLKLGIMDEERRTTLNLKACIYEARERLVFINTGFLDRTGDEIHSSSAAGPFLPKNQIKNMPWIQAYEDWNVDIGLACGLSGKAQIGKGMWAQPDEMAAMLEEKVAHPLSGASTAWVPSPTAATLHAIHYHSVNVLDMQSKRLASDRVKRPDILALPLINPERPLTAKEVERELENNIQGILGYVVRWIDLGVGCSKVPNVAAVNLMEDRATLRISSQHINNWLYHGICTEQQVNRLMRRMAVIVDQQNQNTEDYQPMSDNFEHSVAFQAASQLIFDGHKQPNGYTEPLLHAYRKTFKATTTELATTH